MIPNDTISPTMNPFRPDGAVTLADVAARAEVEMEGTARRDTLSALASLARWTGRGLATIPATPETVRTVLEGLAPTPLGISQKRLANMRSLVTRAVERFGLHRQVLTQAVDLAPDWEALLDRVIVEHHRWGLSRLSAYCSATGIAPDEVGPDALLGLHDALVAESFVKKPRTILKTTIATWNRCRRDVPGWPDIVLASPFKGAPDMLPLDAFPASFGDEIAVWEARMIAPDPFDLTAPAKALRPATILSYRNAIRRVASGLVHRGVLRADEITGFAVLFEGDRFREALRHLLARGTCATPCVHKIATQLVTVARHFLRLPPERLDELDRIVDRLAPGAGGMSRRNRDRLEQFDNPATVRRLLGFPAAEAARARQLANPVRQAKGMERAVATALLIHTGLRLQNLRSLRLDTNLRRAGTRIFLEFATDETKNGIELTLELPPETAALLEEHLALYRPRLPGSEGPYLFPSPTGGARSPSAMRDAVSKPLKRHAGIVINPHLYRHVIAKIVAERNPELIPAVSRHLGHKSIATTMRAYLGAQTRAASREINRLLDDAARKPG